MDKGLHKAKQKVLRNMEPEQVRETCFSFLCKSACLYCMVSIML